MQQSIQHDARREPDLVREAMSHVALALPRNQRINCQDDGGVTCSLGALQEPRREVWFSPRVELKPFWPGNRLRDLLERGVRGGGEREADARGRCCPREAKVALRPKEAV